MRTKSKLKRKYGRLTVIGLSHKAKRKDCNSYRSYYKCLCQCGNTTVVRESDIKAGGVISCGCFRREFAKKQHTTHGMKYTRFYGCWNAMKNRCYNKKMKAFKNYGGRGIKVSNRWHDYNNFHKDMYKKYLSHIERFGKLQTTLDRINNNKDYSKDNCRWATRIEQANNNRGNRIITINGRTQNLTKWSKEFNISVQSLSYRLKSGYYNSIDHNT